VLIAVRELLEGDRGRLVSTNRTGEVALGVE
jgi:hypothetical protein